MNGTWGAALKVPRSDGMLPPHVMVYLMLALFSDDDHEETAARLTDIITSWGVLG